MKPRQGVTRDAAEPLERLQQTNGRLPGIPRSGPSWGPGRFYVAVSSAEIGFASGVVRTSRTVPERRERGLPRPWTAS